MTSAPQNSRTAVVDEATLSALPNSLPHAPPFRLVDRVRSADVERGIVVATRRITACALWPAPTYFFPEVLVIEALCQAAACLNILEARLDAATDAATDAARPHLGYLVAVSNFRFQDNCESSIRDGARVGDTLILQVERQSRMGALVSFAAIARVSEIDADLDANLDANLVGDSQKNPPRQLASGTLLFAIA